MEKQLDLFESLDEKDINQLFADEPVHVASEEEVQTLTNQLLAQQGNIKPEKAAEMVFSHYYPKYVSLISGLSNKNSRRLNEALIGFPLELSSMKFSESNATEAFELAKILIDSRFILQQKALSDKLAELEKVENVNTSGT